MIILYIILFLLYNGQYEMFVPKYPHYYHIRWIITVFYYVLYQHVQDIVTYFCILKWWRYLIIYNMYKNEMGKMRLIKYIHGTSIKSIIIMYNGRLLKAFLKYVWKETYYWYYETEMNLSVMHKCTPKKSILCFYLNPSFFIMRINMFWIVKSIK